MRWYKFLLCFLSAVPLFGQKAILFTTQDSIAFGEDWEIKLVLEGIDKNEISYVDWRSFQGFECPANDTISVSVDIELTNAGSFQGDDFFWTQEEINFQITEESTLQNTFQITTWEHFDCRLAGPVIMLKDSSIIRTGWMPTVPLKSPLNKGLSPLTLGLPIQTIVDSSALEKAPILDNIKAEPGFNWVLFWLIVHWLMIASLLVWLWKGKSTSASVEEPKTIEVPEPILPPHEVALSALETLRQNETWKHQNDKEFVSQLTGIIRQYIKGKFDISAEEKTTNEILNDLRAIQSSEQLEVLSNTLNVADLIKFAKAQADDHTYSQFVDEAIQWVHSTKDLNSEQL